MLSETHNVGSEPNDQKAQAEHCPESGYKKTDVPRCVRNVGVNSEVNIEQPIRVTEPA
jgi:hypothetical protein